MTTLGSVMTLAGGFLALWVASPRISSGVLSPGQALGLAAVLHTALAAAQRILASAVDVERIGNLVERVLEFQTGTVEAGAGEQPPSSGGRPRFRGEIELDSVSFRYVENAPVLAGVNLRIDAGQHVCLLGRTGAGKSTLARLLLRLVEPQEGEIRIDGRRYQDWDLSTLRARIAWVSPESLLFDDTAFSNIAFGTPGAGLGEVTAAARLAGADDFLRHLPERYATPIGERGRLLSGGERQRVALARALAKDADILLLDEPLSGLDPVTAAEVRGAIREATRGRTMIWITHQPEDTAGADRVLLVRDGTVVEAEAEHLQHVVQGHETPMPGRGARVP